MNEDIEQRMGAQNFALLAIVLVAQQLEELNMRARRRYGNINDRKDNKKPRVVARLEFSE